jgi:pimeloyl-ACP methyl ester carboxylesterase
MRHKFILILSLALMLFTACQKEDFTKSGMANDHFFIDAEGQSIPVRVAGNLDSKKMLIITHGGPGGSAFVYRSNYVIDRVEKEFAVVYWDQPFAGTSQGNGKICTLPMYRDYLKKLIVLLKSKYGTDNKLFLMGHSWGGFLAPYFLIEDNNQDLVTGWIQVDGAHNIRFNPFVKNMFLTYGPVEIAAKRDSAFWQEAINYCNSDEYDENNYDVLLKLNGYAHQAGSILPQVAKPDYSDYYPDFNNYTSTTVQTINNLTTLYSLNLFEKAFNENPVVGNLNLIKIPTLLLWGEHDFVCPLALKDDILKNIGSSDVSEHIFSASAHSPMVNEPEPFWTEVINWVSSH